MVDVHPEWRELVEFAYDTLDKDYKDFLKNSIFIPNRSNIFNAFKTLPKSRVRYILFGQDPYPRAKSAIGYAFIDGAVKKIFSDSGLSKEVNKATSLRNFVKMALVADGKLSLDNVTQEAIAKIEKIEFINSIDELRCNFENSGVLLLNSALVFESKNRSRYHIKHWRPFIRTILANMHKDVELILFGQLAKEIKSFPESSRFFHHILEHPYNHTFISNPKALKLFAPMQLLKKDRKVLKNLEIK